MYTEGSFSVVPWIKKICLSLQDFPVIPIKTAKSELKASNCTHDGDKNSAVLQY